MMVQFPVSLGLMALGLILVAFVAAIQPDAPWHVFPGVLGIGFVVLVGPFTIYWGLAQSVPMSWAAYRWLRKFFRERNLLNEG
ncbi:MAG: hypothetical protein EOP87_09170 [Verrucomicrobiaceae bacterium]|nr:MAG: hypothetical protein EOP87_09170 [Verrucomicrobiaceae bacterium]